MASELQLVAVTAEATPATAWWESAIDLLDHLEARAGAGSSPTATCRS